MSEKKLVKKWIFSLVVNDGVRVRRPSQQVPAEVRPESITLFQSKERIREQLPRQFDQKVDKERSMLNL